MNSSEDIGEAYFVVDMSDGAFDATGPSVISTTIINRFQMLFVFNAHLGRIDS